MIDLRSDTVTRPTPAMRMAMAAAVVGDDAFGEDPTVNELERRAAEILQKEAALFVPSGTMANTIAIKLHTKHGDEVICAERSHIADWEMGAATWYCGCTIRQVASPDGILSWQGIEPQIRPAKPVFAPTTLISLEHPHNMYGGTLYPLDQLDDICDHAHARRIRVHMDGSRIFNAVAATGISAARIAAKADTVMFCLSKGLGAPVGSMLVGSAELVVHARTHRRRLGGGWRQAGVLAAAGRIALEEMRDRLGEDHANARRLADGLARVSGVSIAPEEVVTNIVIFDTADAGLAAVDVGAQLKRRGVLVSIAGPTRVRMVTHLDVTAEDCERAVRAVEQVLSASVPATATGHP
jgi:threonine aldolase